MIEYFKTEQTGKVVKSNKFEKNTWINIVDPCESEMQRVIEETGVEREFLIHPLDPEEKARIDQEENQLLIIIDIPTEIPEDYPEFSTIPLGVIIMENNIITVTRKSNSVFDDFKKNKLKDFSTVKKSRFLFQIFYKVARSYLQYLKRINKRSNNIEQQLHMSMENEELYALLNLEKSLVYFTTALKSNEAVMEKIFKQQLLDMYEEDKDIMEDAIIENRQALEMAHIYSNILSGMMDAFASVISNNLNMVMKFLASITIILSLPTMVASFYGMNVRLPFQGQGNAFSIIMILSIIVAIIVAGVLAKKNML